MGDTERRAASLKHRIHWGVWPMLGVAVVCAATLYAHLALTWGSTNTVYEQEKITNDSYPNELQVHFGKPHRSFPQSALGLPDDGLCDEWTNEVSWRVIVCWGTQPEAQPQ